MLRASSSVSCRPPAAAQLCQRARGASASCPAAAAGGRRSQHVRCAVATDAPPVAAARRVRLADSDLLVSECCLGTMTWGEQNTEAEAHQQLSYAWDQGINFMDTAEMYPVPPKPETQGSTDRYIASWLRTRRREDVVLATKVAGYGSERTQHVRGRQTRVTPDQIEESVNNSLKRLGTDHIDLLQIHWPDRYVSLFGAGPYDRTKEREDDIPFEEQLRGLDHVVKAGKVRYVGLSNETSYGVMRFCEAAQRAGLPRPVSIQNCYSLLVRLGFETDLAEVCAPRQSNVGLLAYSPLAGGALSGKYIKSSPAKARFNIFPGYMERYNQSLACEAVAAYVEVARKYGLTPAQLALAWCQSRWFVTSTIIGATSLDQLKENLDAFAVELPEECFKDVEAVHKRYRDPAMSA